MSASSRAAPRDTREQTTISLGSLVRRFWRRTVLTWMLVILEGASLVTMPMVIGWAVDDLMDDRYAGIGKLGGLSVLLLAFGAARRLYDTRAYGSIYTTVAQELVDRERCHGDVSTTTARVNLFSEFIEFLEDAVPGIIQQIIGLVGTLVIVAFISTKVFVGCLICVVVTAVVYGLSQGVIFRFNAGGNNEYERQVDVLATGDPDCTRRHFATLVRWRIKLSDLETLNFSLIWLGLGGLLLYTVIAVTSSGESSPGQIMSALMYVLGFAEGIMVVPFYYQQFVRLQEIASRLERPPVGRRTPA